jgi:NADP-dependent 3-hydroxy acid dehydrogenase YdfG
MSVFAGRRALITGGTRGIGAATARALAGAGALVAVSARSASDGRTLVESLGAGHLAIGADLAADGGVEAVVSSVTRWAGGAPDIVVNNAGTFPNASIEEQSSEELSRTLRLNVEAPFQLVRAFLGAMRKRRSGDIVTIGSVADKTAFTGNAAYSASKYGLRALHEVLRLETRGSGVRAILVSPGAVDTDIWDPHQAAIGTRFPKRADMLEADDVARAILFAVSQPAHVDIDELRLTRS